jgi:hypothetical protein
MKMLASIFAAVTRYVAWFGLSALGLWDVQQVRGVLFDILVRVHANPWAIPGISNFFTAVVFMAWLAIVIWLENYLTQSQSLRLFWERLARWACLLVAILVACIVLQKLI